jgi:AraC-like DNA-binding protein
VARGAITEEEAAAGARDTSAHRASDQFAADVVPMTRKGADGNSRYTVAEIAETFHVSRNTIYRHLESTVTRGYYRVGDDRRRAAVDTVTAMSGLPAQPPDQHPPPSRRDQHRRRDTQDARHPSLALPLLLQPDITTP